MNDDDINLDAPLDAPIRPFIRIYDIPVEIRMQSHGTTWRLFIQGNDSNIELTYNGLYNLRATEGKLFNITAGHSFIWTSEHRMKCFFFNQYDLKHFDWPRANKFAHKKLDELKTTHYVFMDNPKDESILEYPIAPMRNKPKLDEGDFKRAALKHAFAAK